MTNRLWGVYPYVAFTLFFGVPIIRMVFRPYGFTTRASGGDEVAWFFAAFMLVFITTGIGNGSTFRTIAMIFPKEQAGPALGGTSAVAAYGAFIIPQVFGEKINVATPQYALYGFAIFYFICLALNCWFYLGPKRSFDNP